MIDPSRRPQIEGWLSRCLGGDPLELAGSEALVLKPEREVYDCTYRAGGAEGRAVLTVFKPGDLKTVNTSLPPTEASRLCALAMRELPALGIPTPRLLGQVALGELAAIATAWIEPVAWAPSPRLDAAKILARIHGLTEEDLSPELRELTRRSDPRMYRTTGGLAPRSPWTTLVHGDYFSKNILPTSDGLCIIDWETFGWGDPMWDLGFLVGADRDLPVDDVERTISAYALHAPIDRVCLDWHRRRWRAFWSERDLAG